MHIKNMTEQMAEENSKNLEWQYKVDHYYLSLFDHVLYKKVDLIDSNADADIKFNHRDLTELINSVGSKAGVEFPQMRVLKDIIDYQFERYTIFAFKLQFAVFFYFYIVPLVWLVYTKNSIVQKVCIASCLTIQAGIAFMEYVNIRIKGFKNYSSDPWNRIDLCMILVNICYFTSLTDRNPESGDTDTTSTMLALVSVPFGFLKLMYFLRGIYEDFGQLISLIAICL
jgi:hypothetical protein